MPEFLRFYQGYTHQSLLDTPAQTFFSFVNSMFRIKANESLDRITEHNADQEVLDNLKKKSTGIHGILEEVRTVERVKKNVN